MSKHNGNLTFKIFGVGVCAIVGGVIIVGTISGHKKDTTPTPSKTVAVTDSATGDTAVETLKTLTATVGNVQDQNKKVLAAAQADKQETQQSLSQFKTTLTQQLNDKLSEMTQQNQAFQNQIQNSITQQSQSYNYDVNGGQGQNGSHMTWVSDLQESAQNGSPEGLPSKSLTSKNLVNKGDDGLSGIDGLNQATVSNKVKAIPYYTIPVNATLTGAIALQPILGEVPVNNQLVDPYQFKMMLSAKNLAANGIDMPEELQGIVAAGTAQGSLIGPINKQSCVRGNITSMTFIFNDGRISTTEADTGKSLGTISDDQGYPCITGILESNAPQYLGVTMGLGALQGYAQGLSQSQLNNTTTTAGTTVASLAGSYTKFAAGQTAASGITAAQQWFNQRMQNSTDLIVVPNYNATTHEYYKFNINITQQIAIDYNKTGRKLNYEHDQNTDAKNLD